MDYEKLTAPCGRDCFNCNYYLASQIESYRDRLVNKLTLEQEEVVCQGCRQNEGKCKILKNSGFNENCKTYKCAESKNVKFCFECSEFPCDLLHPVVDRADEFTHNLKVYNLCMIKKMGLENWAKNKSKESLNIYLNNKLDSCV